MDGDCGVGAGWGGSANTWSALGYLVAAGFLVVSVVRGRLPRATLLLGAALAAEAAGSLLAHGPGGSAALAVHDLALVAIVGYMAGWHLGRLRDRPGAGAVTGAVTATIAAAVTWRWWGGVASTLALLGVAAVVAAELAARRRTLTPVWAGSLIGLAGVAVAAWLAGRTGSPLCDPASPLQGHAAWHLLTAYLVVAWALASSAVTGRRPERAGDRP